MGTYTAGCFGLLADKAMFLPLINHLVVASVMGMVFSVFGNLAG
ncbi:hypothetical protein HanPI659440_Chr07g0276871 [Helianthus annuus]|nr:hypothetical protein HanPI659440_Chr07g0276871 [Helianthus annuus]